MKRGVFSLVMVLVAGMLTGVGQNARAQGVTECSNIVNEHVRLACFDRAVSDMRERGSPATDYGQPPPSQYPAAQYQPLYRTPVPPVTRLPVRTYPPMTQPSPAMAARLASPKVPAGTVRSRVISHDRVFKKYILVLENGQVWKQTGGGTKLPLPEYEPAYALVRDSVHDGFLLSIEGSRKTIPVKRLK